MYLKGKGTVFLKFYDRNDNISESAFSGDLFEVIMLPLTLNALSEGTEVAGIHKYFLASNDKRQLHRIGFPPLNYNWME